MVLKHIGVLSTAKMLGVMYFLITALFCIPAGLIFMVVGAAGQDAAGGFLGGIGMLFMPLLYGAGGFLGGALMAAVYNILAGFVGGIEVEMGQ